MHTRTIAGSILVALIANQSAAAFTEGERQQVVRYWNAQGRYQVSSPDGGPYQVRLTPEGSKWLWDYNRARGIGKLPPGTVRPPKSPDEAAWERWIEAKVAFDRWEANVEAAERNSEALQKERALVVGKASNPGEPPASLVRLVGEPPPFAAVVQPKKHTITFEDMTIAFVDNPNMRHRYAYYRWCDGVMSGGTAVKSMPADVLDKLFEKAGVSESAQKVMKSVSLLEGGFDSVNTYDTGFVSVGFIQFACLKDGAGSLGAVLQAEKADSPAAYDKDFRRFGLDVSAEGALIAVDPISGEETVGAAAAAVIIKDKRLIATFQRAGRVSEAFKIAQIKVAYEQYYPASDLVAVLVGYSTLTGRIGDIIKSESGLATLMDRKVNTGKVQPLVSILARIAAANDIGAFEDFANYEREIVAGLKYRRDYMAYSDLTQPGAITEPRRGPLPSRHQPRNGRKKGGTTPEASPAPQPVGTFAIRF